MLSITPHGVVHIPPSPQVSAHQALAALANLAAGLSQHPLEHDLSQAVALLERYIRQQNRFTHRQP